MNKVALTAIIGLLLLATPVWSAQVTNVELSYQDGRTVARIDVEGQVRFTHETEVPKNGRPDRVIVDILSATHELGAKTFLDLPNCVITGIRTSQFAVTPEKIVRVVFDLKTASIYKVAAEGQSVVVTFDHREPTSFATWTSRAASAPKAAPVKPAVTAPAEKPAAPPKTVAQKNDSIEKDRLASLAPEKTKTEPASPAKEKPAVSPTPKKTVDKSDEPQDRPAKSDKPAVTKSNPPVPSQLPPDKSRTELATVTVAPAPVKSPAPAPVQPTPSEKSSPAKSEKTASKPEPQKKASQPAPPAVKKETAKSTVKVAQSDPPSKPAPATEKRQTARFRREAQSDKIRGTMVAEFPKRLVIKYQTNGRRDPFGALVDASKTNDEPVLNRVPNVEGLKLVGVIEADGGANRALFEDKNGFSYILKSGDKVRNGYVLRVEPGQVYFQIFEYGWSRTVALTME